MIVVDSNVLAYLYLPSESMDAKLIKAFPRIINPLIAA